MGVYFWSPYLAYNEVHLYFKAWQLQKKKSYRVQYIYGNFFTSGPVRISLRPTKGGHSSGPIAIVQTRLLRLHDRQQGLRQNDWNVAAITFLPDDDDTQHNLTGNKNNQI